VKLWPRRLLRIRVTPTPAADPFVAVDLVRLRPSDSWHTGQIDEEDLEAVDYQLTSLGPAKTRLDLRVTERWVIADHLSREEALRMISAAWDRYALRIEARFRRGRPAQG